MRNWLLILLLPLLSSCGGGLCVIDQCATTLANSLALAVPGDETGSAIASFSVRKNDCTPITLLAYNAAGAKGLSSNTVADLTSSAGLKIYDTLEGCQTYDASHETAAFPMTPSAPNAAVFIRSDVTGVVTFEASAPGSGLASAKAEVVSTFTPYAARAFSSAAAFISLQASGRTIVTGSFLTYDGTTRNGVARLLADGSLDTTFATTGAGFGSANATLEAPDGKIYITSASATYNGTNTGYLARLNSDGTLDSTFTFTGTGLNNATEEVYLDASSRPLVVGFFASYNGTPRRGFARLTATGNLDATFLGGTGCNATAYEMEVQSDGKYLISGAFTTYDGTTRNYIARVNTDGSTDTTFAPTGTGFNNQVRAMKLQTDGKIVVGGLFTSYNGTSAPYVARLNADGSLDTSFAMTGAGPNSSVAVIALQGSKVLVGGPFTTINGVARAYLARFNSDGSLDTSFLLGASGPSANIIDLLPLSDGKILVGGQFTSFSGTARDYVARITYDGTLD